MIYHVTPVKSRNFNCRHLSIKDQKDRETHLGFQLLVLRLDLAAIAFDLLQFGAQHEELLVGGLQLLLGAVDVEEGRDSDQEAPPGPVTDGQEGLHIPLDAANGQFLRTFQRLIKKYQNYE